MQCDWHGPCLSSFSEIVKPAALVLFAFQPVDAHFELIQVRRCPRRHLRVRALLRCQIRNLPLLFLLPLLESILPLGLAWTRPLPPSPAKL